MVSNGFWINVAELLQKYFNLTGALKEVVSGCKEGQSVRELCMKADALLAEETGKAFKKDKKVLKGKIVGL